jgi:hypothetical protein
MLNFVGEGPGEKKTEGIMKGRRYDGRRGRCGHTRHSEGSNSMPAECSFLLLLCLLDGGNLSMLPANKRKVELPLVKMEMEGRGEG